MNEETSSLSLGETVAGLAIVVFAASRVVVTFGVLSTCDFAVEIGRKIKILLKGKSL